MTSESNQQPGHLRQRAEAILAERAGSGLTVSPDDIRVLLHDLSVYQIELELQNEELQRAQQEAERIRDSYANLYHQAPVGYLTLSPQGLITRHNQTFATLTGLTSAQIQGTPLANLLIEEDREIFLGRFRSVYSNPVEKEQEVRLLRHDNTPVWVRLTGCRTPDAAEISGTTDDESGLLIIVDDIHRRKEAEEALLSRSSFIAALLDTVPNPLFYKDTQGRYLGGNRAFTELIGVPPDAIKGKRVVDVAPPELATIYENHDRHLLVYPGSDTYECQVQRADLSLRDVIFSKATFVDATGKVAGIVGAVTDITDLKREAAELERSRAELQAIYDNAPVMMCLLNQDRSVVYANLALAEFTGLTPTELQSGRACGVIGCIHALDDSRGCGHGPTCQTCALRLAILETFRTGTPCRNIEYRTTLLNRSVRREVVLRGDTALIQAGGKAQLLLCMEDITERVTAAEIIKKSLKEKEVLLAEIHHRVKNNLQLISSLLNLQTYTLKDKAVLDIFQMSQNRVKAIALVHEKLYRSQDFAEVDFHDFLNELVAILYRSYGMIRNINLNVAVDTGILLRMDEANPCGLIVTELFVNCLKYAFPHNQAGTITIRMTRQNGAIQLCVADDGVGLPPTFDPYRTESLGYQLVTSLAQQIGATMSIDTSGGTSVCITWPHA